jgi:hypothetical protein
VELDGSDDEGAAGGAEEGAADAKGKAAKGKAAKGKAAKRDAGGAAAGGAGGAAKAHDAKLSTQLQDIRRTLVERHGEKHEGAFAKRERGADAASPVHATASEGEAKARAKRLRL